MASSRKSIKLNGPKVLFLDIETAPIIAHVWSLWDQNVGLNQIGSDWHVLSWSAKWQSSNKVMYSDQRGSKNIEDDKKILQGIWELLDTADVVIGQNSKNFDIKKLNARFIINGMKPPSPFKQIDTLQIAKKHFGFTSNKLAYMTEKLNTKYKKLEHKKFPGHELWSECLKGNKDAWNEMKLYNIHDVLALEELYGKLIPWSDDAVNFNLYDEENTENTCKCGGKSFRNKGYYYTQTGMFSRHVCNKCGAPSRGRKNLFSKEKRDSLRLNVPR